jgi:hypothetical protein
MLLQDHSKKLGATSQCVRVKHIIRARTTVRGGQWAIRDLKPNPGSMLFVSRYGADLKKHELFALVEGEYIGLRNF